MFSNQSIKEIEDFKVALTLTVDKASIEEAYKKELEKYAKNATFHGFRKGKAPLDLVEKKIGQAIRQDVSFQCLETELKACIDTLDEDKKPLPYSTPELQDEDKLVPFKPNEDITFTVHYEIKPEFKVGNYKGLNISIPKVRVTDKDVDNELMKIREQNAMVIAKEGCLEKGDVATVNHVELDKDKKEVEGTKREDFTFTVGNSYNYYEYDEEIIGMKVGEKKEIVKTYPESHESSLLRGKTVTVLVELVALKERKLPELDDELAQDYKDEYKTLADLIKAKKEELNTTLANRMKELKLDRLVKEISNSTTLTVPPSMVQFEVESQWREMLRSNSNLSESQFLKYAELSGQTKDSIMELWRAPARDNIKVQLILEKIQKTEDFSPNEEEYNKQVEEMTAKVTDEKQVELYKNMIKDDLTYKMVPDFLLENNTFTEAEELSFEDFLAGKANEKAQEN